MGGWVDGWMGGKAGLRIAYSNQKPTQIIFCLDFGIFNKNKVFYSTK
jgi:hypothetical protein